MQVVLPDQANVVGLPLVARADGTPIITGVINFYLVDLSTGKWFRGSDSSWQDVEALGGVGTHRADGHWYVSLVTAAWVLNKRYRLYAKESGNLHISVGEEVKCEIPSYGPGNVKKTYTVKDGDGNPIDGVDVWVTSDIAGSNIIASGVTNIQGQVDFYLTVGTYYVWSQKAGYNFTNPDTEVVS